MGSVVVIRERDKRRHPRRAFRADVRVRDSETGAEYSATAVDINPRGMALLSRTPLPDGCTIELTFPSPECGDLVTVTGEVVRSDARGRWQRVRSAVVFSAVEESVFTELCDHVYRVSDKTPLLMLLRSE